MEQCTATAGGRVARAAGTPIEALALGMRPGLAGTGHGERATSGSKPACSAWWSARPTAATWSADRTSLGAPKQFALIDHYQTT